MPFTGVACSAHVFGVRFFFGAADQTPGIHPGVSVFPKRFAILGRGRDAGSRVNEMPAIPGWRVSEDAAHGSP
jgi:hypothetical protein